MFVARFSMPRIVAHLVSGVSVLGVTVFCRGIARFLAVVLFVVTPGLMDLPASLDADEMLECWE
jgi:hypothetical protein